MGEPSDGGVCNIQKGMNGYQLGLAPKQDRYVQFVGDLCPPLDLNHLQQEN